MKTVAVVTVVLLVAMVFVEVGTRALDEQTHHYGRALSTLDAFAIADTRINNGVLESRAGLLHDYDQLVTDDQRAWTALTRLGKLGQRDRILSTAIDALERDYRVKSAYLEQFKSQNALLGNSLAYFWHESSVRVRASTDVAGLRRLGALTSAMQQLSMDGSADAQALARKRLEEVAASGDLAPLLRHGHMLMELLPATEATIQRLRSVTELPSYRNVRDVLRQRLATLDARRGDLRLAMLAMSAIMVAMLVYLAVLLRNRACTLRRRADFDHMMASISRDLIGCEHARLDYAVLAALERIANWLDLPYVGLVARRGSGPARTWPEPRAAAASAATMAALALPVPADGHAHDIAVVLDDGTALVLSRSHCKRLPEAHWICLRRHGGGATAMLCFRYNTRRGGFPRDHRLAPLLYSALDTLVGALGRRRLENEANALERRLERARRMETIGAMTSGISHNFNNIVGAIRANAEAASDTLPPGAQAQAHLVEIDRVTSHASALVEAILGFGRAQNHNVQLVELDSLLQETHSLLRVSFPEAVTLDVQTEGAPFYVQGSPSQLQQVILNLVNNAVQAMRREGAVSIRLGIGSTPCRVRLSITDNGIGIPADRLEQIFDPFYTTREGGTGLGLATVKQIVGNHEGRIEVQSHPGAGATFIVELPLCLSDAMQAQRPVQPSHCRLLLLCDERATLERLEDVLAALGHEPVGHLEAIAARRMLIDQAELFDGLVVHRSTADRTVQAAYVLHAAAPRLPLLLVIPACTPLPIAGLRHHAYETLTTPYSPGSLMQALERALATRAG